MGKAPVKLDPRFVPQEGKRLYRSKRHGCFKMMLHPLWGTFLTPVEDPDGDDIAAEDITGIELVADFGLVDSDAWAAWISLTMHMCPEKSKEDKARLSLGGFRWFRNSNALEVSAIFLRNKENPNIWRIMIPDQEVSKGSVKANFHKLCDILTGERIETPEGSNPIPKGWFHAGSTHSHNDMPAFFSGTDDENELHVQGLHIVVGEIDKAEGSYSYEASIVMRGQRKSVTLDEVVNLKASSSTFHKNVLEYIVRAKPMVSVYSDGEELTLEDSSSLTLGPDETEAKKEAANVD